MTEEQPLAPRIGRFSVLRKLGEGGMGMVLAGYDERLDRKLAIKLVHPKHSSSHGQLRMQREAQALARLSHPNVVQVYEVGEHEGATYIAMEFVVGRTLRVWLDEQPRRWREILTVFHSAGLGLAAAHEAGLVHRDFKPDNVIVQDDGQVKVLDFGLVREQRGPEDQADPSSAGASDITLRSEQLATDGDDITVVEAGLDDSPSEPALQLDLTQAGTLVGTLSYMAPEQARGQRGDARTDQYSFCLSLWEALYRQRAFAGEDWARRMLAATQGNIVEPPRSAKVPRWVRKVVERGLAPKPEDRWPSMPALLDALQRDPARRRWIGVSVALGLALVGTAFGVTRVERAQAIAGCEAEGEAIASLWSDDRRAQVEAAIVVDGSLRKRDAWTRIDGGMNELVEQWRGVATRNCVEGAVEQRRSAELVALTRECLAERRVDLEQVGGALMQASVEQIDELVAKVAGARPPAICAELRVLLGRPQPPADRAEAIAAVRERAWRATDRAVLEAMLGEARALDWPPLHATVEYQLASRLNDQADYPAAREHAERAFIEALAAGDDVLASRSANLLVIVLDDLDQRDSSLGWGRIGLALADRLSPPEVDDPLVDELRTMLFWNLAVTHRHRREFDQALTYNFRALELIERRDGKDSTAAARLLGNLGIVYRHLGDDEQALAHYQRSQALVERHLGSDHVDFATGLTNIAGIYRRRGDVERALDSYRRALAIFETRDPNHPRVADVLGHTAWALHEQGQSREALRLYERSLEIRERAFGGDDVRVAEICVNMGGIHSSLGEHPQALAWLARGVAIFEAKDQPDDPRRSIAALDYGRALLAAGETAQAIEQLERAVSLREQYSGDPAALADARAALDEALASGDR